MDNQLNVQDVNTSITLAVAQEISRKTTALLSSLLVYYVDELTQMA